MLGLIGRKFYYGLMLQERRARDPTLGMAKTDQYVCPECQDKDAYFKTEQERLEGEHEPVTVTSVYCAKCGHSWKILWNDGIDWFIYHVLMIDDLFQYYGELRFWLDLITNSSEYYIIMWFLCYFSLFL